MSYSCKIILDSISETGKRLATFEITFPRIVLSEFNTHRMFSRNSASSRAIPFSKMLQKVEENPFIPERFPVDGKGMQPNKYIDKVIQPEDYKYTKNIWLAARDSALESAKHLYNTFTDYDISSEEVHIHKQIVNRLLEPFMWHTVIITATEFDNFFKLRTHSDAQYEIKRIADLMYELYHCRLDCEYHKYIDHHNLCLDCDKPESWHYETQKLNIGEWHCPLVSEEDGVMVKNYLLLKEKELRHLSNIELSKFVQELKKKISVARCARVSYLTHDGKRDIEKDLELFERLKNSGHWSPFEHVATPYYDNAIALPPKRDLWSANFLGWKQYRKEFQDENCINFRKNT